jgi:hypothetical protein
MGRWKCGAIIQELRFSERLNLEASATRTMEFNGVRASALARRVGCVANGAYFCCIHNCFSL